MDMMLPPTKSSKSFFRAN